METESQQDSMGIGKEKDEQERAEGLGDGTAEPGVGYEESRRLWKLYLAGKITATDLNKRLIGETKPSTIEDKIKNLFDAKEI